MYSRKGLVFEGHAFLIRVKLMMFTGSHCFKGGYDERRSYREGSAASFAVFWGLWT
jgi:hypothetical protein